MGNAAAATSAKGVAAADYGAASFIELLRDVQKFEISRLPNGPLKQKA
jgi:creatinine amidohydrolase